jgi:hypothetical protein
MESVSFMSNSLQAMVNLAPNELVVSGMMNGGKGRGGMENSQRYIVDPQGHSDH